jgi:phenylacetic acid degradation operon negative regulatory protein
VLLRLLADLGVSGTAARSLLLRMRREGLLSSQRAGRQARYLLAPSVSAAQARLYRQLNGERPAWSGSFSGLMFTVPESHRSFRDKLRRLAHLLGYAMLQPGLLIAASDRYEELAALLPPQPPGSQVLRASLTFSAADSREIAADRWDLRGLAGRYRAVIAEADEHVRAAARQRRGDAAALRAFAAATLPLYEAAVADPDLPAELLPADWPGPEISALLGQAFRAFGPSLGEYLATVIDPLRGGPRPEPRPGPVRPIRRVPRGGRGRP